MIEPWFLILAFGGTVIGLADWVATNDPVSLLIAVFITALVYDVADE